MNGLYTTDEAGPGSCRSGSDTSGNCKFPQDCSDFAGAKCMDNSLFSCQQATRNIVYRDGCCINSWKEFMYAVEPSKIDTIDKFFSRIEFLANECCELGAFDPAPCQEPIHTACQIDKVKLDPLEFDTRVDYAFATYGIPLNRIRLNHFKEVVATDIASMLGLLVSQVTITDVTDNGAGKARVAFKVYSRSKAVNDKIYATHAALKSDFSAPKAEFLEASSCVDGVAYPSGYTCSSASIATVSTTTLIVAILVSLLI